MFKKLIIPVIGIFFILALVSCIPTIRDISAPIDESKKVKEKLDQREIEIEEFETELENEK